MFAFNELSSYLECRQIPTCQRTPLKQRCRRPARHRHHIVFNVFTSGQEAFKGSENTAEVEVPQACIVLIGFGVEAVLAV